MDWAGSCGVAVTFGKSALSAGYWSLVGGRTSARLVMWVHAFYKCV